MGNLIFLCRKIESEAWNVFTKAVPGECRIVLIDPNETKKAASQIATTDYLITYRSGHVSPEIIDVAKHLKLIHTMGQGVDHLPVRKARSRGIYVCNNGGANSRSVAELTIFLILALLRRIRPFTDSFKSGQFQGKADIRSVHEFCDKTIGILGFGNIGRYVAKLSHGFGANVVFYGRTAVSHDVRIGFKARQVGFDELLSISDIVTLHMPSNPGTKGIINWQKLSMMKSNAYLINTSRADLVNQADLIRALKEKEIAGAGLDVWEPEPPDPENQLIHMDNVFVTPHIGALAWENWEPRVQAAWKNIRRVSEGKEPINQV